MPACQVVAILPGQVGAQPGRGSWTHQHPVAQGRAAAPTPGSCFLQYYAECHGVIYVIDSTDEERLPESKQAFGEWPHPLR